MWQLTLTSVTPAPADAGETSFFLPHGTFTATIPVDGDAGPATMDTGRAEWMVASCDRRDRTARRGRLVIAARCDESLATSLAKPLGARGDTPGAHLEQVRVAMSPRSVLALCSLFFLAECGSGLDGPAERDKSAATAQPSDPTGRLTDDWEAPVTGVRSELRDAGRGR
jgi:hypothetical protein